MILYAVKIVNKRPRKCDAIYDVFPIRRNYGLRLGLGFRVRVKG